MPIELVFRRVRDAVAGVRIERLTVTHAADDDNVWWVWTGTGREADADRSVQIDTHPGGTPPFLLEGSTPGQRLESSDATEATAAILKWL